MAAYTSMVTILRISKTPKNSSSAITMIAANPLRVVHSRQLVFDL